MTVKIRSYGEQNRLVMVGQNGIATTKCTPDLIQKFASVIRQGGSPRMACAFCKITYRTYQSWKDKGEREVEPFYSFVIEAQAASYVRDQRMVKVVTDHAESGDEQAHASAKWMLTKLNPDFTEKKSVSVSNDMGDMSDEELTSALCQQVELLPDSEARRRLYESLKHEYMAPLEAQLNEPISGEEGGS
jgi:hypothetical protein